MCGTNGALQIRGCDLCSMRAARNVVCASTYRILLLGSSEGECRHYETHYLPICRFEEEKRKGWLEIISKTCILRIVLAI